MNDCAWIYENYSVNWLRNKYENGLCSNEHY